MRHSCYVSFTRVHARASVCACEGCPRESVKSSHQGQVEGNLHGSHLGVQMWERGLETSVGTVTAQTKGSGRQLGSGETCEDLSHTD